MQSAPPDTLTTVVNYWPELPPTKLGELEESARRIGIQPIYRLPELLAKFPAEDFLAVTRKCKDDLAELQWTTTHVLRALQAATSDCYRNSHWCQTSSGGKWIPCDAYVLAGQKTGDSPPRLVDVYIKFGLSSETGKAVLVVSCHEPEEMP